VAPLLSGTLFDSWCTKLFYDKMVFDNTQQSSYDKYLH